MRFPDSVYRSLFEAHPLATLLVSRDELRIVDANLAAARLLRLPPDDLIGRTLLEFVPPEDESTFVALLRAPAGLPARTSQLRRPTGDTRVVAIDVHPSDAAGVPLVLVVLRDVSDQVQRATARERAVERQRLIARLGSDASWDWDVLTGSLWWDDSVERLFGYPRADVGDDISWWAERVHPDDRERVERSLADAFASDAELWETEYRFRRADGHYVDVRDRGAIVRDATGRAVRMVGAMVDISEYRRITRTLEESEARYRTIFEQAPLGIAEIDIFGTIVRANTAFSRLFGIPSTTDQSQHVLSLIAEEDRELVRSAAIQAQQSRTPSLDREVRLRRRDGSTFWGTVSISVVFDDHKQPLFGIALIEDISSRKEAEQRVQLMAQAEKLQALGQMASGVAHNVNQSLGLIAGHSQLALAELDRPTPNLARLRESLLLIRQAVEEGAATAKRLLAFARPHAEGVPTRIDLGALLEDVARLTAPRWRDLAQQEGRPIRLTVQAEPGLTVEGWPEALHEALVNLVFNAVDALPSGGTIALWAYREDREAVIEVADTGIGMPEEMLGQIFEPFFTTKGEHGTGIGLPTVFRIVERHHGTIAVRSKVGAGSTFTIRLPIANAPIAAPASPARTERGPTQHVLVVDDDHRLAEMARQMLELDHHDVTTANSAEEALRHLDAAPFDVVICDLGLGAGMNGWELAATVRQRWPGTRFILATGWGAELDAAEAQTRGVDAIIAKPFTVADLRRQLAR